MSARRINTRRWLAAGVAAPFAISVAACGAAGDGGGSGGSSSKATSYDFLVNTENTTIPAVLKSLSTGSCKTENDDLPLKVETVPQTQLDQKLQLLAGQNALPVQFAAGNAPQLTQDLADNGQVLDVGSALSDLGEGEAILPAAADTIKALYGGKVNVLPYQYNVEGIWYNKQILADNGISAPGTWDDLVSAAAKLDDAGIQPFSASGEQGWPITRLISGYLFRSLGPDAMQKIADGSAKLTDPDYVQAAQAIADLGKDGYFGKGVGSIDYDTAMNTFMTGKAAMFYMGSWALSNFNSDDDKIGADNIGFMPFPAVTGGAGDINAYPSNVGLPMALSAKKYDKATVGPWLKCIAENYGTESLKSQNSISGFKLNGSVSVDPLTQSVQDTINNSKSSVLWFEALFNTKATTVSQTNAAQLASGSMSPEDFMSKVQAAITTS